MSKLTKKDYDKLSIVKEIIERENIIRQYQETGVLDRKAAIDKIISLQFTDPDIAIATAAKQKQCGGVDLYQADNNLIITNIQFQIEILKVRHAKLELEEKENGGK